MILIYTPIYTVAGLPGNVSAEMDTATQILRVQWERPRSGVTNEAVNGYKIECSTLYDITVYTMKRSVDNMTLAVTIQLYGDFISPVTYNCCVEAVFETYSSIACTTVVYEDPMNVTDSSMLGTKIHPAVTYTTSGPCMTSTSKPVKGLNIGTQLSDMTTSYALFGSLGFLILILLFALVTTTLVLIYIRSHYIHSKPYQTR